MGLFDAAMRIIYAGFAAIFAVYVGYGVAQFHDALLIGACLFGVAAMYAMIYLHTDRKREKKVQ